MLIERWANTELLTKLSTNRVVSVVGCRQSGKTTLLLNAPLQHTRFLSLDTQATFDEAKSDPSFFVRRQSPTTLIIDEIQKVPQLIGEIKYRVDRNPDKGQYIISGSSDYRKLPQANESLAGRAGFVRVRTFCEAEKRGYAPGFLQSLFEKKFPSDKNFECSKPLVLSTAIHGGFPELLTLSDVDSRTSWFADYLSNQVLLDMREQWGVRKKNTIEEVLKAAAIFSSRGMVKATLAADFNIAWKTLDTYFSAIEAMYLVDMVPGWAKKDYDKPGLTPKPFMTDSGLMAHLLHIYSPDDILNNNEKSQNEGGKLVETWVYNQLVPEVDLHAPWNIHHFRSRRHEIDFLITNEKGHVLGIEVKAGESVASDDFQHLHWMQELLGEDHFTGIILYSGNQVRSGGRGCFALPMAAMWSDFSTWTPFD